MTTSGGGDLADRLRLDVPVVQAGMGGGIAGPRLAGAVAAAGALGTLGLAAPAELRAAIGAVREHAPGRAVAVNLLMPFVRRHHVRTCIDAGIDVAVLAFRPPSAALVAALRDAGIVVMAMVGTIAQTREAVRAGVDAVIAQGREAGGHLVGTRAALDFLPDALAAADGRPVLLAGGIATADDTAAALEAGAAAVVAGTRFLLTAESGAHPAYRSRVLAASATVETTLFGLSWPLRHRVVPNAATSRWCRADGSARALPAAVNAGSSPLARVADRISAVAPRLQRAALPLFSPVPPRADMPEAVLERAALYAGQTALRIDAVVSAAQAVRALSPR
ncbi:nitronate monooxygenase [Mycolicibacillus parakoreensis]|uniref:Nitronate monooxygenase n=1 Tax=Mycolicibacillus parakoreensis TaxID=1069221 RepID=A0ABY3U5J5_9MYCO|nr:nitronate monooxygenase [Mycolicibacillus parakoreensis]MCV7316437.1 nitronate monooxygenase [Mycolicibacillus parakoreensis]ULN52674.1 nitronate monooxygenase [Mycolicibacillus parakoreensis]